jgi:hypothetical protein
VKDELRKSSFSEYLVEFHERYGFFAFWGKDNPEDFIKIEPLNVAKELPMLPVKDELPSFEGAVIHYGFKFVPMKEFHTLLTNASWDEEMEKLSGKMSKYADVAKLPLDQIEKAVVGATGNIMAAARVLKLTPDQVTRAIELAELKEKEQGLSGNRPFLSGRDATNFLSAIQWAFLKVMKHSKNAPQLREQFIEKAVENYVRMYPNKCYDFVVYPQSSGMMNVELASAFSAYYGRDVEGRCRAVPIQGFQKVSKPGIDSQGLFAKSAADSAQKRLKFLQAQVATSGGQIKNVRSRDRQYVRLWEPTSRRENNFKNKRILVIDDNVATSGTLQAVYHVLQKEGPRLVDIYTPLYVEFYH